ncbi:hypothetical protein WM40_04975 [Robbsia andropogonis]|uniref:Uncharacterized protein n=1 Tax=Robbsia andropogonis TaxID=28092 RepID=A0A0F5K5B5_9BURK|nr:hypothetical protein WM40_04975 [Robbsia andropogonis]
MSRWQDPAPYVRRLAHCPARLSNQGDDVASLRSGDVWRGMWAIFDRCQGRYLDEMGYGVTRTYDRVMSTFNMGHRNGARTGLADFKMACDIEW